jgi:hypothetical protein
MNRKVPVPFLGEGTAATPSPYPTSPVYGFCQFRAVVFEGMAPPTKQRIPPNARDRPPLLAVGCIDWADSCVAKRF